MKTKYVSYSIIIIALLSLNSYYSIINKNYFLNHKELLIEGGLNLKLSGFWTEEDFNFIHIDDNWSASATQFDWVYWDSTFSKYIIENVSLNCAGNPFGILIENSMTWDFEIRNCTIYNASSYGIRIDNTWSGIIDDCSLLNNYYGISITGGSIAIVVQNCDITNNSDFGIYMSFSDFNTVRWSNITSNNGGVIASYSDSFNVLDNNISNNNGNGLQFARCDDCYIEDNTLNDNTGAGYFNGGAIYWDGGSNNVITKNQISSNREGIYFTRTAGSSGTSFLGISNNNVTFNTRAGISVGDSSVANTVNIRDNNVSGNNLRGIQVFWARDTTIDDNYVDNNGDHGVTVAVDHDTTVSDNIVSNNGGYGIWHPDEYVPRENLVIHNNTVSGNSNYNIYIESFDDHPTYPGKFTNNTIIGNIAVDERTSVYDPNAWNFNFFSYYSGEDANDDGIGNTAQDLYNPTITIQDHNPVWWDSPIINITSPTTDEVVNVTAPAITYDVSRGIADTLWYNLNDSTIQTQNYTYLSSINQPAWDQMNEGAVWINFYVNDSRGWEHSDVVQVIKDSVGIPRVSISGVSEGDLFGKVAPSAISILVTDPDGVDESWYRLENSTYSTDNSTWLGYIEQSVWNLISNGSVTIVFYANDTLNHIGSSQVTIRKDIFPPSINITNPSHMELVSSNVPFVNVSFSDINGIAERWYDLYNDTYTTIFTNWTDSIDPLIWGEIGNGTVTIRIWANDTAGNIGFDEVTVHKDILPPSIKITNPSHMELVSFNVPFVNVSFSDPNGISERWYNLYNDTYTTININWTGSIDPLIWGEIGNGTVTLRIWANDTLGNLVFNEVTMQKDITAPSLSINFPFNGDSFNEIAPEFSIDIFESNLHDIWYTIDQGLTNFSCGLTGTFDQTIWSAQPDGPITVIFYANDTLGNINSESVNIIKDTIEPTINLITPTLNEIFGEEAPDFVVEINDTNLDLMWYTLNGGLTNYTFITNESIDQSEWTAHIDGLVTIIFYAKDIVGNKNNVQIIIRKDTSNPIITIISPTSGDVFGNTPPSFNITVTDPNLDTIWYTVDGSLTILGNTLVWTISQEVWDALPEGTVTITIHANDTLGHSASQIIIITKNIPSREIGLDYIMTGFLITLFCGVAVIIVITKMYHKKQILT